MNSYKYEKEKIRLLVALECDNEIAEVVPIPCLHLPNIDTCFVVHTSNNILARKISEFISLLQDINYNPTHVSREWEDLDFTFDDIIIRFVALNMDETFKNLSDADKCYLALCGLQKI